MKLSQANVRAFLLDMNRYIEESAEYSVHSILEVQNYKVFYPPNGGYSEDEILELKKLAKNESLKSALRKLLADHSGDVVFHMLNLIDGTTTPDLINQWSGLKLIDENENENQEEFGEYFLHDEFLDMNIEWQNYRENKT